MTVKEILAKLSKYEKKISNFPIEELCNMDSSYKAMIFEGSTENIYKDSSQAIKNGLPINGDTIYFLLFGNEEDRISIITNSIPMDEIRDLKLNERYAAFVLPANEGKEDVKLLLIYK